MGRFQRSSYGIRRLWTRKRIAQALDLRAEFGDFGDGMRVFGGGSGANRAIERVLWGGLISKDIVKVSEKKHAV